MSKGVLGIKLNFYAVVAFLLAMIGQWLPAFLVLAFVMAVEKDEWVTRQCMQAAFLGFIILVAGVLEGFAMGIISMLRNFGATLGNASGIITGVFDIFSWLLHILVLVLAIVGLSRAMRGQEANTPIVAGFADKAYGRIRPQPMYQPMQQPMYPQYPQQPMQQPMPPQQPMQQPPMPPQQPMQPPPPQQNMGGMPPAPPNGNI